MISCRVCSQPAVVEELIDPVVIPTGVTVSGFLMQKLSGGIRWWKHPDGRFCYEASHPLAP